MRGFKELLVTLLSSCLVSSSAQQNATRSKKLFSLFNVVNFENGPCTSTATVGGVGRHGTCFTSNECTNKGGEGTNTCAAGFGVCCVFTTSDTSATVSQNCTYLQNPGFPAALTAPTPITYNVQRTDPSVCFLRLDFETFSIRATMGTEENANHECWDTFTVTSPGITNRPYPVICGLNTGEHVYVDFGQGTDSDVNLAFQFTSDNNAPVQSSNWDIKVTQVACGGRNTPPTGCFQWHTATTGTLMTFNFANTGDSIHLQNQDYSICIRQAAGYCCIQYSVCDPDQAQSFSLSGGWQFVVNTNAAANNFALEDNCFTDYIRIAGAMSTCAQTPGNEIHDKFCGHKFSTRTKIVNAAGDALTYNVQNMPVCDCSPPFAVDIITDADGDEVTILNPPVAGEFPLVPEAFPTLPNANPGANNMLSKGVCLTYLQIPCS